MTRHLTQYFFGTLIACGFAVALSSCSSSTSVTPSTSGVLTAPSTIDFGNLAQHQTHDTTVRISNTGNDSLVITGNTAGAGVADTNFKSGLTLKAGAYQDVHIQVTPPDTGSFSSVDSIRYTSGGSQQFAVIQLKAHVTRGLPGAGSTFTYDVFATDTNGVAGPHADSVYTVVSNSMTYAGKTNVVAVLHPDGVDTSFYHQEANGDLATYVNLKRTGLPVTIPQVWLVIPFSSKAEIRDTLVQQNNVTIPGVPVPVNVTIASDAQASGNESIPVGSEIFDSQKGFLKLDVHGSALGGLVQGDQTGTTNIWYSPSLHFYTKRADVTQNFGSTLKSTLTFTLKAYTYK